jgi:outer membrane murein-binding lipoprotein Lpp
MRTVSLTLTAVLTLAVLLLVQCAPSQSQEPRAAPEATLATLESQVQDLQETVARLSYNSASGGGVNLKMMPDPETGEPVVPMQEVFSFDRNHAMCRVDTNPEPFKMQTHEMGEVVIEAHQFYMSMVATSIEQYEVTTEADGMRRVTMRGGLDCATEVGQAKTTIGSRTAAEHATYLIEATDGGIGGGEAGDRFAFTVYFDPDEAPVNYAIFGPEFTFTGEMIEGEISIDVP